MKLLGGSIAQSGDSGRLGPDSWATDFAHPAVLSRLPPDPTFSISSATDPDVLELSIVFSRTLWSLSAFAFILTFSGSRSFCCRSILSSCCCGCVSSFRRRIFFTFNFSLYLPVSQLLFCSWLSHQVSKFHLSDLTLSRRAWVGIVGYFSRLKAAKFWKKPQHFLPLDLRCPLHFHLFCY